MAQIINIGTTLLRINPTNSNKIEYSSNNGKLWISRYASSNYGEFRDLLLFGSEIFAVTSKGIYISKNEGRNWIPRYTNSTYGEFESIVANGTELLAITSKGTYASKNEGRNWIKKN